MLYEYPFKKAKTHQTAFHVKRLCIHYIFGLLNEFVLLLFRRYLSCGLLRNKELAFECTQLTIHTIFDQHQGGGKTTQQRGRITDRKFPKHHGQDWLVCLGLLLVFVLVDYLLYKYTMLKGFVDSILNWFRSLFWKQEMELTLVGLQNSGKTTLVNVLCVCDLPPTLFLAHFCAVWPVP